MSEDKNKKSLKVNDECTGCGTCVSMYPEIFEFGDDGKAKVKEDADFDGEDVEEIKEMCPVSAIE
jgi:ferredoxin